MFSTQFCWNIWAASGRVWQQLRIKNNEEAMIVIRVRKGNCGAHGFHFPAAPHEMFSVEVELKKANLQKWFLMDFILSFIYI